jgi:hypothetical protein
MFVNNNKKVHKKQQASLIKVLDVEPAESIIDLRE